LREEEGFAEGIVQPLAAAVLALTLSNPFVRHMRAEREKKVT
jgi:hypothetical protein